MHNRTINALVALSILEGRNQIEESPVIVFKLQKGKGIVEFDPSAKERPWSLQRLVSLSGIGTHPVIVDFESLEEVLNSVRIEDMEISYCNRFGGFLEIMVHYEGDLKIVEIFSRTLNVEKVKVVRGERLYDISVKEES